MPERVLFPDKPCKTIRHGRWYNGQWRAEGGRLHVGSAYGSKDVALDPEVSSYDELKAAAEQVLGQIVEARYGA